MINYLIMDVDGTLTDGKVYMGSEGEAIKAFSIKDGYVINYILKPVNIVPIIITARTSSIVQHRCDELGITEVYQGKTDKLFTLKEIVGESKFENCAYFGDDILDLMCMSPIKKSGGIVGCHADAVQEVKAIADYICVNKAGEGALREFAEWLIQPEIDQGTLEKRVADAVDYINSLKKGNLICGKYEVNENFYYLVQEYNTNSKSECVLESHKRYIDIQWIIEGEEAIDIADVSGLQIDREYSDEKDIMFWHANSNMMRVVLKPESYTILYPQNAHMGGIAVKNTKWVKKIVGKIRIY